MELFYRELVNHGLQLIATLLAAIVAPLIVKILVSAINKINNDKIQGIVWNLIMAAEKKFGSGTGTLKIDFVTSNLIKMIPALKNNRLEIDTLIHATLRALDIEILKNAPTSLKIPVEGGGNS